MALLRFHDTSAYLERPLALSMKMHAAFVKFLDLAALYPPIGEPHGASHRDAPGHLGALAAEVSRAVPRVADEPIHARGPRWRRTAGRGVEAGKGRMAVRSPLGAGRVDRSTSRAGPPGVRTSTATGSTGAGSIEPAVILARVVSANWARRAGSRAGKVAAGRAGSRVIGVCPRRVRTGVAVTAAAG